jgi:hypothetical protein
VWQEDIRKFLAAQVRVLKARIKQLGHNDIEARFLLIHFRHFVLPLSSSSQDSQATNGQLTGFLLQAIHLVGKVGSLHPRDFEALLAGIKEDNPGIKVMHRRRQT